MRIAITHPTTFNRVRRGSERFVHELATYLAGRGHSVRVIACKPGPREVATLDGYTQDSHRRMWHPAMGRLGVIEAYSFLITSMRDLLTQRFDIVQCCSFTDAFGASLARAWTGVPYAFLVNGLPPRVPYFRALTTKGAVFRRSVLAADELMVPSGYVGQYCKERFGREGSVLAPPVNLEVFRLSTERDHSNPIILCAADLSDQRKGGDVLMRAFNLVKATRPTARLKIWSQVPPENVRAQLLSLVEPVWREDVAFVGPGTIEELPGIYGRAAVSVLPSMWEAFGMVITESLATGTPVVGTRDGAIPSILDDPAVGRLFDPGSDAAVTPTNVTGLAQAILETLAMSRLQETALRCRRHVERYSWAAMGPQYEDIYQRMAAGRSNRR